MQTQLIHTAIPMSNIKNHIIIVGYGTIYHRHSMLECGIKQRDAY